jgi:hypothetical protein
VLAGLADWAAKVVDNVAGMLSAGLPPSVSEPVFEGLRRSARVLSS